MTASSSPPRMLVASRDAVYARFLCARLEAAGFRAAAWPWRGDGQAAPDPGAVDVLLIETWDFAEAWVLVEQTRERSPMTEIVAISSDPAIEAAIEALRCGVFAVLTYPVSDAPLIEAVREAHARKRRGEERIRALQAGTPRPRSPARGTE